MPSHSYTSGTPQDVAFLSLEWILIWEPKAARRLKASSRSYSQSTGQPDESCPKEPASQKCAYQKNGQEESRHSVILQLSERKGQVNGLRNRGIRAHLHKLHDMCWTGYLMIPATRAKWTVFPMTYMQWAATSTLHKNWTCNAEMKGEFDSYFQSLPHPIPKNFMSANWTRKLRKIYDSRVFPWRTASIPTC